MVISTQHQDARESFPKPTMIILKAFSKIWGFFSDLHLPGNHSLIPRMRIRNLPQNKNIIGLVHFIHPLQRNFISGIIITVEACKRRDINGKNQHEKDINPQQNRDIVKFSFCTKKINYVSW